MKSVDDKKKVDDRKKAFGTWCDTLLLACNQPGLEPIQPSEKHEETKEKPEKPEKKSKPKKKKSKKSKKEKEEKDRDVLPALEAHPIKRPSSTPAPTSNKKSRTSASNRSLPTMPAIPSKTPTMTINLYSEISDKSEWIKEYNHTNHLIWGDIDIRETRDIKEKVVAIKTHGPYLCTAIRPLPEDHRSYSSTQTNYGLFTTRRLHRRFNLCIFTGQVVRRVGQPTLGRDDLRSLVKGDNGLDIDTSDTGNESRFINIWTKCGKEANCEPVRVRLQHSGELAVIIRTTRDIQDGEEIILQNKEH